MTVVLDTNILVRYADPTSPMHLIAIAAIRTLQAAGERLAIVPQNVHEFWATATRPFAANGLGLSVAACQAKLNTLTQLFDFLPDQPALFTTWESLVGQHQCLGRVSFDARLVAAMRTHGLTHLLTFNAADFARFPGLTVLDPAAVAAPPPTP